VKFETRDVSESSFLAEFPETSGEDANRSAVALADRLARKPPRGLLDAIPGATTLFVLFDPGIVERARLVRRLRRLAEEPETAPRETRRFRIPVAYGGDFGPDLSVLASQRGISAAELARRHAGADYTVAFLGFSPGFAYLTGLPPGLSAPRRDSPRTRVPAGSLAIGGDYTAIYPAETPGGWMLIGRSPVRLFDPAAHPPALLRPGDRVFFQPMTDEEFRARIAENMALQRTRRPRLRSGRSLRSLGSPLNASRTGEGSAPPASEDVLFETLTAGLFTSVQGPPRFGMGASGVAAGGAMDLPALERGNAIVGNAGGAAGLEITLSGPELLLATDALLCVTGADLDARWNGSPVPLDAAFPAKAGDRISFRYAAAGMRAYLCVQGGLALPLPGEPVARLAKGDSIARARPPAPAGPRVPPGAGPVAPGRDLALRVLPGPQPSFFSAGAIDVLLSATYRVSPDSDRRGIRLDGPPLELTQPPDIPPEGTALGSIQVPANGLPIVLGPDRPVTGGYAKIATVVASDWPLLAQALPGTAIRFRPAGPGAFLA
jgi:KipI family sensor histidine kinase inhibitor